MNNERTIIICKSLFRHSYRRQIRAKAICVLYRPILISRCPVTKETTTNKQTNAHWFYVVVTVGDPRDRKWAHEIDQACPRRTIDWREKSRRSSSKVHRFYSHYRPLWAVNHRAVVYKRRHNATAPTTIAGCIHLRPQHPQIPQTKRRAFVDEIASM